MIFDHLAARHQVTPVMTAARAAIDQARRNEQPVIKIGNEFQPRDIMMNALRRHATMARWDPRFDTDSAFYLPKWKSDAFCNPALDQLVAEHQIEQLALAGLQASACVTATVKSALASGLRVQLLADAIACRTDAS